MNKKVLKSFGTNFVFWSFLTIGITGLMLYFEIGKQFAKHPHEQVGIIFTIVALVHLITHFKKIKEYVKSKMFIVSFILIAIVTTLTTIESLEHSKKKSPRVSKILIKTISELQVKDLPQNIFVKKERMVELFKQNNIEYTQEETLEEISNMNEIRVEKLIQILLKKG